MRPPMGAQAMLEAGEALFGKSWKKQMGALLDLTERQISRFVPQDLDKADPIDEAYRPLIIEALRKKRKTIEKDLHREMLKQLEDKRKKIDKALRILLSEGGTIDYTINLDDERDA